MSRLVALESLRGLRRGRRRCVIRLDRSPQLGGVGFTGESCDWRLHEIWVAEVARAVDERASHRFGDEVDVAWRIVTGSCEIVALEDVQHLHERGTTRAWRRHRDDLVAAVSAANRCALFRLVLRQILHRDESAAASHFLGQQTGCLTAVESVAPLYADAELSTRHSR